jgi:CheY-like chemotaxis protein
MEKPLILLIDPSVDTRAMYGEYFRFHGYTVAEAADTAEALRLFPELQPDLVVTEFSLDPEWCDAIRAMRDQGNGYKTATILCSVMIDAAWPFAPPGIEADLALPKPISPRALLLQAEQVLRARLRARRAVAV